MTELTLQRALGNEAAQAVLMILGSGMSACFSRDEIEVLGEWKGKGVEGHPGLIARWDYAQTPVLLLMGRRHLYEGYTPNQVAEIVHVAGRLGVQRLVVTSAVGGLHPLLHKGEIVLHEGYLPALLGRRRLLGQAIHGTEVPAQVAGSVYLRGCPLAEDLYPLIHQKSMENGVRLKQGVYAGVLGPSYETRAEIRALRRMGGDLVGMSVISEVEAAAQHNMRVVGLSLVTNVASELPRYKLSHGEVTEASSDAADQLRKVLEATVEVLKR